MWSEADIDAWRCGRTESAGSFGRRMELEVTPVPARHDVDYVWPRARAGADHPWNYLPVPQGVNRSWGARIWPKIRTMPLRTLLGFVVSAAHVVALR